MLRANRGFSLVELLVSTAVMMAALATAGTFFVANRNFFQDQILRTETQQGLRATLDNLERDLRLGGACLPVNGDFISLGATNAGTLDSVVTRTGLVRPNLSCVRTTLSNPLQTSDTQLAVNTASGFSPGMRIYVRNSTTGEYFTLTTVDATNKILRKAGGSNLAYPIGSGVYAIDERNYSIDTSNSALPVLKLAVNSAAPIALAFGVESVNIRYQLMRNCPPLGSACDVVDLPATSEWSLVNQLFISVTVRSRTLGRDGQYYRRTGEIAAKPRNLLPGTQVLGTELNPN